MERIIKIKYNQELLKNQVRLERQLAMVNNELKEVQSTCNHINIILGSDNKYSYSCLEKRTCGADIDNKNIPRIEFVLATNYWLSTGTKLCITGDIKGIKNDMAKQICIGMGAIHWPQGGENTFYKIN